MVPNFPMRRHPVLFCDTSSHTLSSTTNIINFFCTPHKYPNLELGVSYIPVMCEHRVFSSALPCNPLVITSGFCSISQECLAPCMAYMCRLPANWKYLLCSYGLFTQHLQSGSDAHSLHSHCTRVGVKPDWIRIHLNPLREVVLIRIEVNPV